MTTIYSKDSFDRFGDDLCEDILSYLPLEDGIKYECLSHQWKRSVYKRVDKLIIRNSNALNVLLFSEKQLERGVPGLESVLKKCPDIRFVNIDNLRVSKDIIIDLISKYCMNLKSVNNDSIGLSRTFIETIGHKLESICFTHSNSNENFAKLNCVEFARLKRLDINSCLKLKVDRKDLINFSIKQLTHLKLNCYHIEEDFLRTIIRNNKQIRRLNITSHSDHSNTSEELLTQLSDLTQLESLAILLSTDAKSDAILAKFQIIGQKCHELKKLSIDDSNCNNRLRLMWLSILEFYPNLVSLELKLFKNNKEYFEDSFTSCELLAKCPNLQNFMLRIGHLSDDFFEDIHKYVPKLRHLSIYKSDISEPIIDYIEKISGLQTLVIESRNNLYTKIKQQTEFEQISNLFRSCARLKSVHLSFGKDKFKFYRHYSGGITKLSHCPDNWFHSNLAIA